MQHVIKQMISYIVEILYFSLTFLRITNYLEMFSVHLFLLIKRVELKLCEKINKSEKFNMHFNVGT